MGKVKKNWANLVPDNTTEKNEEQNELTSESECLDTESEEDSSNMELSDTSGDDDVIVVSNLFVYYYIYTYNIIDEYII